jgi:hypothetical protein
MLHSQFLFCSYSHIHVLHALLPSLLPMSHDYTLRFQSDHLPIYVLSLHTHILHCYRYWYIYSIACWLKNSRPATLTYTHAYWYYTYERGFTQRCIYSLSWSPGCWILDSQNSHIVIETLWLRYSTHTYWSCCWSTRLLVRFLHPTSVTTLSSVAVYTHTHTKLQYPLSTHINTTVGLPVYC